MKASEDFSPEALFVFIDYFTKSLKALPYYFTSCGTKHTTQEKGSPQRFLQSSMAFLHIFDCYLFDVLLIVIIILTTSNEILFLNADGKFEEHVRDSVHMMLYGTVHSLNQNLIYVVAVCFIMQLGKVLIDSLIAEITLAFKA